MARVCISAVSLRSPREADGARRRKQNLEKEEKGKKPTKRDIRKKFPILPDAFVVSENDRTVLRKQGVESRPMGLTQACRVFGGPLFLEQLENAPRHRCF